MHPGGSPFEPQSASPFGEPPVSGFGIPHGTDLGFGAPAGFQQLPPPKPPLNLFAALSPVFAVVIPPAGVALGHLALPQIRRTGERGRPAAIAGLIIGYLLCAALIGALIWWATADADTDSTSAVSTTSTPAMIPATTRPRPTTVTKTALPPGGSRIKVDHATVPVGTCVEVQRRSTDTTESLDLFEVDCERREGVYTVTARVARPTQCATVYVAVPADRSVAVCLDPY